MTKKILLLFCFFLFVLLILFISIIKKETVRPNVILIMADALRPDHLSCYGYARLTSPSLDSFAKISTIYRHTFSSASWTIPSGYSLLTSLHPVEHRMRSWGSVLDTRTPNIISSLHKKGYSIGIFGDQELFFKNIEQNFGDVLNGFHVSSDPFDATKNALEWIDSKKSPFFLWIYYLAPHRPYRPLEPYKHMFAASSDVRVPIKKTEKSYEGGWDYLPEMFTENNIDDPSYYVSQYDGAIRTVDEEIGKLLKALKEKNLFDNSLIIFTSDHGESMGEHHLYFNHLYTLFNEIVKVPLVIKNPGQREGRVVQENTGLVDIFPTICDAVGLKKHKDFKGVALAGLKSGNRLFLASAAPLGREWITAVIEGDWKLIKYAHSMDSDTEYIKIFFPQYPKSLYQLFNIKEDPSELVNLIKERNDIFLRLRQYLDRAEAFDAGAEVEVGAFALDEDSKKRLKSLGYAQ
jgi:arylsulfatase A-like enzyme